jgi:hypothetical protein
MPAHIRIQRAHAFRDRLNAYSVYIDGKKVGKVRDNSEVEFEVSPGQRQVQMRVPIWTRGKAITVNVPEGGSSHLLTSGGSTAAALGAGFGIAGALVGGAIEKASGKGPAGVRRLQLIELSAVAAE